MDDLEKRFELLTDDDDVDNEGRNKELSDRSGVDVESLAK